MNALGEARVRDAVRLFMVPGMHHCFNIDYQVAYIVKLDVPAVLREWVHTKKAPDQLVVTTAFKNQPERRRLVCAYPRISYYSGQGSADDPANFVCREPS